MMRIAEFAAQNLANTVWALAKISMRDLPLLELIAMCVAEVAEWDTQGLANTAWSFATLKFRNEQVLMALAAQTTAKQK